MKDSNLKAALDRAQGRRKQGAGDKAPAFLATVMDIAGNVLRNADNPGDLGTYLTEEVRRLTGAGCVLLVQCQDARPAHRVVGVNPLQRREWAESSAGNRVCETVHRVSAGHLWRKQESSEVAGLLRQEGFELSMMFPINAGAFRAGGLFVLGLPDEEQVSAVHDLLNDLSAIVALVLRSAVLRERTAELQERNERLATELTERKRADKAPHDAGEYIRQLISSANVMIIGLDAAGGVRMFNKAAEKITGYTVGELTGIDWFEKIVPKDRYAWVWETFLNYRRKAGSMPATLENPILTKSGEERFISWQNSTISIPGSDISIISFGIDITERRLAETKLVEQRAFLHKTIESLTHPFYIIDAVNYTIVMANAAARLDISTGETCYALTHGRDKPCSGDAHLCPLEMVKQTKKSVAVEHAHYDKEGNVKFFEVNGYPILDEGGNVVQMIEYALDITERRKMERALRKQEAELNESQRLAHIGSWDWDAVNDAIWWSDEYYRIYGLDPHEPTPNYVEHLKAYTPESGERLDAVVKRAMETGEPYELDLELAEPTASAQWVLARGEAKRDANGKIWGLRGTAQNITERKKAEEELKKLNEELDLRVKERTSELERKIAEIELINKLFVGRELRMVELKEKIKELENRQTRAG